MARKYKFITFDDRKRIARLWSIGTPAQAIAGEIDVSLGSLYRELKRGYPGKVGQNQRPAYNPVIAQKSVEAGLAQKGRRAAGSS